MTCVEQCEGDGETKARRITDSVAAVTAEKNMNLCQHPKALGLFWGDSIGWEILSCY